MINESLQRLRTVIILFTLYHVYQVGLVSAHIFSLQYLSFKVFFIHD